jgi:hypothetical protein
MTSLTPDLQEKTVSAGITLGLFSLGEKQLFSSNKVTVELAFGRAWSSWAHKDRFPSVFKSNSFNNRRRDPYYMITGYDAKKTSPWSPVVWSGSSAYDKSLCVRPLVIWEDYGLEGSAVSLMYDNPVPGAGWVDLAAALRDEIKIIGKG